MISFRPKKTGPRPLVTVREVYDKTCAVERAVGELQRTLDGRALARHRGGADAAFLAAGNVRPRLPLAREQRHNPGYGAGRDALFRRDRAGTRAAGHRVAAAAALAL